jgi:hypothetical protein
MTKCPFFPMHGKMQKMVNKISRKFPEDMDRNFAPNE